MESISFYCSEDNSTSSSGENIRYLFPSSSADDLRGHGPVKRPGLVLFDDHEGGTSELDYYYGIGKFIQKIILLRRFRKYY